MGTATRFFGPRNEHPDHTEYDRKSAKLDDELQVHVEAAHRKVKVFSLDLHCAREEERLSDIAEAVEMQQLYTPFIREDDSDRDEHYAKVCKELGDEKIRQMCDEAWRAKETWAKCARVLIAEVLTDAERLHATRYATDKEYRYAGDSLMAKAHRHKSETMRDLTSVLVKTHGLTKDIALMKVYLQIRRGFKMFCLSADDQEAFDTVMSGLDRMPGEFQRALRERTQSP